MPPKMWTKTLTFARRPIGVHLLRRDGTIAPTSSVVTNPQRRPKPKPSSAESLRIEAVQEAILTAIRSLDQRQSEFIRQLHQIAVELSVAATRRFVGDKFENDQAEIGHLVEEGLQYFDRHAHLSVMISERDFHRMQELDEEARPSWLDSERIQIQADPSQPAGSFRIDSSEFELAFDWEVQLEELHLALTTALSDQGA